MGVGCVDAHADGRAAGLFERQAVQPLALHVGTQPQGAGMRVVLQQLRGRHRLAATRQAVHDDHAHGPGVCQLFCQRQIGQRLGLYGAMGLGGADGGHLGAHHGPVYGVETQHPGGIVVAAAAECFIHEPVGQARLAMVQQVDVGERDFTGHVDPAQVLVELDAIEHAHPAIDTDQVAEVQVAMAFAHPTRRFAGLQDRRQPGEFGFGPLAQVIQPVAEFILWQKLLEFVEVFQCRRHHLLLGPKAGRWRRNGCAGVELRQCGGKVGQMFWAQVSTLAHAVEPAIFVEAAHAHRVFDRLAVVAPSRIIRRADDGHHVQVDVGRKAAVQAQLVLAANVPEFERAEVQKRQLQGLLDLVGEFARQQDPGDVGLHQRDLVHGARVARGLKQGADQRGQVGLHGPHRARSQRLCQSLYARGVSVPAEVGEPRGPTNCRRSCPPPCGLLLYLAATIDRSSRRRGLLVRADGLVPHQATGPSPWRRE